MAMSAKHIPWKVIIGFTAIGVIVTTISVGCGVTSFVHLAGSERTEGVIVGFNPVQRSLGMERPEQPAPIVEYQVEGETYRIDGHFASASPSGYQTGEKVVVAYQQDSPSEGRIDSFGEMWLGPLVFGSVGALFTFIGMAMVRSKRRTVRD